MYVTDFEFNNKRLSDFGFVVGHIDSSAGTKRVNIGCDITFTTVKNNHSSIHSTTSSSYENVYTTTFEIIRFDCAKNPENVYLNELEIRSITRWLNRRGYYKFKPYDKDFDTDIHHYGSFNIETIFLYGKPVGFSLTFTSNAPYAFAEQITTKHMMLNSEDRISIYGDSDEYTTILPQIEIKCFQDGDLTLTNHTTGSFININNCKKGELIILDGEHKIPISIDDSHITFPNDFNYEYLEILVNEDNIENEYSSTLPCELTITYLPIRKVGVL